MIMTPGPSKPGSAVQVTEGQTTCDWLQTRGKPVRYDQELLQVNVTVMPNQVFASAECPLTSPNLAPHGFIHHYSSAPQVLCFVIVQFPIHYPDLQSFCLMSQSLSQPHSIHSIHLLLVYLASHSCPTSSPILSMLITYSPCFIHMSSTYTHTPCTYNSLACTCIVATTFLVCLFVRTSQYVTSRD